MRSATTRRCWGGPGRGAASGVKLQTSRSRRIAAPARDAAPGVRLADHTTLRVGGPARHGGHRRHARRSSSTPSSRLDAAGEPVLVLGGGSNLWSATRASTARWSRSRPGHRRRRGRLHRRDRHRGRRRGLGRASSAYAIEQEWSGVETLSGIPGLVGATPIQNVGAYGGEVSQTPPDRARWTGRPGSARPSPMATAGSATGPRGSRPSPAAT